ncbi:MAG: hypothetical protein IJ371_03755 [Clostridia bacterium]|nr:hypothetical protein [Clostridia bacterium]
MRLGRRVKLNMMIAILLCMVFVVNLGVTWASAEYKFWASSINSSTTSGTTTTDKYDTYIDFASAQGSSGTYVYSPGVVNNQLTIDYGFRQEQDLMIEFTVTYSNTTHIANDFSINFANRDDWVVDMGTTNDWIPGGEATTYYNLTSSSYTFSGVMYYMGTKTGSGTMPIISGVTFYTSPNNSYNYMLSGDTLTITLTPVYTKTDIDNYTTSHSFYSTSNNVEAFNNWANYMKQRGDGTVANATSIMIYNAYVDQARSIGYPHDDSAMNADGTINTTLKTQPVYSNTAHRYQVNDDGRTYNAITAGNKYYGGLGAYVIPSASLQTVSIVVNYFWQKNGTQGGTTQSGVVELQYGSEIQTITTGTSSYYCYKSRITKPTYVNILESIMLTAVENKTIIANDYTLILNNISVNAVTDATSIPTGDDDSTWSSGTAIPTYEIHNSTATSPILARVSDVYSSSEVYEANVSITNNSPYTMAINKVVISSSLWYAEYETKTKTDETTGQTITYNVLKPMVMGDGYLPSGALIYDDTLWSVGYQNGVFTFSANSDVAHYVPSGYTMTIIKGVEVPETTACQGEDLAYDFWCSLDVSIPTNGISDKGITYTNASTTGVETIIEGYHTAISASKPGEIYIRNNTSQIITELTLSTLDVYALSTSTSFLPRDRIGSKITPSVTSHLSGTVSIKPNEMVHAFTITPNTNAVIYDVKVLASLQNQQEADPLDLVYRQNTNVYNTTTKTYQVTKQGVLINNSDKYYEFRLESTADITSKLIDSGKFETRAITNATTNVTTYYYYYKGIICPGRYIEIFNDVVANVVVNAIEHDETAGIGNYVASNYTEWDLDATADKAWLDAMIKLYDEPSEVDRDTDNIVTVTVTE